MSLTKWSCILFYKAHTVIHKFNWRLKCRYYCLIFFKLVSLFWSHEKALYWRTDQSGVVRSGSRPWAVRWRRGRWDPATRSTVRRRCSWRRRTASDSGWRLVQTAARGPLRRLVGFLMMCRGRCGERPPSLPEQGRAEEPWSGSPRGRGRSLRGSLRVQAMTPLRLPLPEEPGSLPQMR